MCFSLRQLFGFLPGDEVDLVYDQGIDITPLYRHSGFHFNGFSGFKLWISLLFMPKYCKHSFSLLIWGLFLNKKYFELEHLTCSSSPHCLFSLGHPKQSVPMPETPTNNSMCIHQCLSSSILPKEKPVFFYSFEVTDRNFRRMDWNKTRTRVDQFNSLVFFPVTKICLNLLIFFLFSIWLCGFLFAVT